MRNLLNSGAEVVALCDVDDAMVAEARKVGGERVAKATAYNDYRKLLDAETSVEGVLIATPDHWHAPLCRAFMRAGKHVYCEKPLTHTVAQAREIRDLARGTKVVTQMGNQGSATQSMRRCVEVVSAGAIGDVTDVYVWISGISYAHGGGRPPGEDPVPRGFNWDFWVGPAPSARTRPPSTTPTTGAGGTTSAAGSWATSGATRSTSPSAPWG